MTEIADWVLNKCALSRQPLLDDSSTGAEAISLIEETNFDDIEEIDFDGPEPLMDFEGK